MDIRQCQAGGIGGQGRSGGLEPGITRFEECNHFTGKVRSRSAQVDDGLVVQDADPRRAAFGERNQSHCLGPFPDAAANLRATA